MQFDVVIIGGGLAGLTSAINLALKGYSVAVVEKKSYPFHRVCGEFISNEVVPYLKAIDCYPEALKPAQIKTFHLSSNSNTPISSSLPLGAFGISRYAFDFFLAKKATRLGVTVLEKETVEKVQFASDSFDITLLSKQNITAKTVIGAYGKRSNLDRVLNRKFFKVPSSYIGIKYHLSAKNLNATVSLNNFEGGYCGISNIEENKINVCYLTTKMQLAKWGSIAEMEKNTVYKNEYLATQLSGTKHLFNEPKVINEVSFEPKRAVENRILMCGDAAGLVTPLTGNGMAMAICSGAFACEQIHQFFKDNITRIEMENNYARWWNTTFSSRLTIGRNIQPLFGKKLTSELSSGFLKLFPGVLSIIMKKTSGKPSDYVI